MRTSTVTRITYGELRDGIVHDVEGVAADEVERNLNHECRTVNHRGLDDEQEHTRVPEPARHGVPARLPCHEPNPRRDQCGHDDVGGEGKAEHRAVPAFQDLFKKSG